MSDAENENRLRSDDISRLMMMYANLQDAPGTEPWKDREAIRRVLSFLYIHWREEEDAA